MDRDEPGTQLGRLDRGPIEQLDAGLRRALGL